MTSQLLETVTTRANPQIDPSLHVWGWQIVLYLFLGGLVAGILILTAALELKPGQRTRTRALSAMPFVALALLSFGMLFLWLDLEHRLWAWRFYATFRPTSPMSWGAWILVLVYPAGLLFGLGSFDASQRIRLLGGTHERLRASLRELLAFGDRFRRPLLLANVGLGVALGLYTGLLLGTMPARLAWNSAVLGPLFLASGISTGAATLLLLKLPEDERRTLVRWDLVAIGAELVLLALMLVGFGTSGEAGRYAAHGFLGGPYTAVFWSLVVVMGLLVPLAMEFLESRRRLPFIALVPVLILAGGLALRWILLVAGQHSAFRLLP
jgi:formate-dependent nitrite reductase membrane component NrfD